MEIGVPSFITSIICFIAMSRIRGSMAFDQYDNADLSLGVSHIQYDGTTSQVEHSIGLLSLHSDERNMKPIIKMLDSTVNDGKVLVIGIAGGSGSGKTTLSQAIYQEIGEENISYISHDSYYKDLSHLATIEERSEQNFDHPNALDTELLVEHIRSLKAGLSVQIPKYNFSCHSREAATELREPKPIIMVEGILIFSSLELTKLMDIKIFVDTADDIRFIRRLQRDTTERGRTVASVVSQYMTTVRPMHIEFVEPSKRQADVIIPVGLNSVALDLIVSKLKSDFGRNK